ncbi:MAG: hypothetical protein EOM74_04905 [Methanomicrobia archaeon]|nr:hypothetical protein [Methanomicrobia archaeon]
MNNLNIETKRTMKSRIITGIILALIATPAILFGDWFLIAAIFVALMLTVHEFTNAPSHSRYSVFVHLFLYVITASFVFWIFVKNNMNYNINVLGIPALDITKWRLSNGFTNIEISTMGVATAVSVLFLVSILDKKFTIPDLTYLFTMIVFVGIGFQSFLFLRFFPVNSFTAAGGSYIPGKVAGSFLVIYMILGTIGSDIGAYFFGVLFGRSKMNPRISPKKTWEGFFGGIVVSMVISFAFAMIVSALGYPLLPFLTHNDWYWLAGFSVLMPLVANLGDFLFSALKRHFEIKDYGTLLKGHGGILDRVDSLITVSLVTSVFIILLGNGWSLLA